MKRAGTAAVAILLLVAGAGCDRGGVARGEARLTFGEGGSALVAESGEPLATQRGDRTLHQGARIRMLTGSATLALEGGSSLELRGDSTVEVGAPPTLITGEALVSGADRPMTVEAAATRVVVSGAARLSRDLALSAASYRGGLTIESAGRSLAVPPLRQAAIPSLGVLPDGPRPLAYDADDPWDRRFLGAAIDLGEQLEAKSQGFTLSLPPGEGRTAEFFRRLVPRLDAEPAFGPGLLSPTRPAGETLVGSAIVVNGARGTFSSRWAEVFSFREQGATWGLVALDQGVAGDPRLVRSLDDAIARAPLGFVTTAPPPPDEPPSSPPRRGGPPRRTGRQGSTPTPAAPAPRPAPPPPPGQPPPTRQAPLEPVVRPLVDTLNGLLSP